MATESTFFSYSRTDSIFVLKLAKDLRDAGAELWLDQLDIKAGNRWDAAIEAALNSASRIIVVLSPASVDSNNVMDEVSFALESDKTVIPIKISDCTTPFRLKRLQYIDFTGDYQTGLNYLREALGYPIGITLNKGSAVMEKEPLSNPGLSTLPIKEKEDSLPSRTISEPGAEKTKKGISNKYILFSLGVILITLCIWGILKLSSKKSDELKEWNKALSINDNRAYAVYIQNFPDGAHAKQAKEIMDSISELTKPLTLKDSYYYTNFYDHDIIYLRNRPLSKDEINIVNQCTVLTRIKGGKGIKDGELVTNMETIYEDTNKPSCKEKKKLDDETGKGYTKTGVIVELLETKGSFSHIKIVSNGVEGWISSNLQGKPTLVKPNSDLILK